jgi:hypothetical protein
MKRREFIGFLGGATAWVSGVRARPQFETAAALQSDLTRRPPNDAARLIRATKAAGLKVKGVTLKDGTVRVEVADASAASDAAKPNQWDEDSNAPDSKRTPAGRVSFRSSPGKLGPAPYGGAFCFSSPSGVTQCRPLCGKF